MFLILTERIHVSLHYLNSPGSGPQDWISNNLIQKLEHCRKANALFRVPLHPLFSTTSPPSFCICPHFNLYLSSSVTSSLFHLTHSLLSQLLSLPLQPYSSPNFPFFRCPQHFLPLIPNSSSLPRPPTPTPPFRKKPLTLFLTLPFPDKS